MNLIEYARIILRRGWIAVLLAVIAGAAAFGFSQLVTPVYRSSQTMLLVPSRTDLGLAEATIRLINSRRAYLDSNIVAAEIIDELQLDFSPQYLRGQTTITANGTNQSIQIDVDLPANSDEEAARLINPIAAAWGDALIEYQNELNQEARAEDRIRVVRQDNPQLSLLRPNVRIYTAIGAIAGFFLGAILIFVLEYLESNIVRRAEDLERNLELPVLAMVPAE
jgi:capsular polysaccharide biosynthesis protein